MNATSSVLQPQSAPSEAFVVFAGSIEQDPIAKTSKIFAALMNNGVNHIHLLLQSNGGLIPDGVFLYYFFRALPIELTVYNIGSVQSVAVIAYLGARKRRVSAHATFMIHTCSASPPLTTARGLQTIAQSMILNDKRTEAILRENVTLNNNQWENFKRSHLHLSAQEAVKAGMATEIGDFAPPAGCLIQNI